MAFIRVEPVAVQVRTDWFDGRPREVTLGDERLTVTRLVAVREEAAAYPVITGPRTLFEVETSRARLSLTYQHRSRRWTVTGMDEASTGRLIPHPSPATGPPSHRVGIDVGRRGGCAGTALVPFRRPNAHIVGWSRNLQSQA